MTKRNQKFLDIQRKGEQHAVSEEEYTALNDQLCQELPVFLSLMTKVISTIIPVVVEVMIWVHDCFTEVLGSSGLRAYDWDEVLEQWQGNYGEVRLRELIGSRLDDIGNEVVDRRSSRLIKSPKSQKSPPKILQRLRFRDSNPLSQITSRYSTIEKSTDKRFSTTDSISNPFGSDRSSDIFSDSNRTVEPRRSLDEQVEDIVTAVYDYTPTDDDEIALLEGWRILVTQRGNRWGEDSDEWSEGIILGEDAGDWEGFKGWFPTNYVE
ncbi:hypothetical protein HK096_008524 [Nowakowskiella sp. JEL0078]|nr:hypothetical protein HK096_008524 [Nowakowskiella sp. JEL0078]